MTGTAAMAYSRAGCLAEQEGDLAEAARWHTKALALLAEGAASLLPSNPLLATVVEGLAALAAARGDYPAAAERLGLADALHGFRDASSLELTGPSWPPGPRSARNAWRRPTPAAGRSAGPARWLSCPDRARRARQRLTPGGRTSAWPAGTPR
jgi:hypothetical protein